MPVKGLAVDCAAHGEPFCIIFWPDAPWLFLSFLFLGGWTVWAPCASSVFLFCWLLHCLYIFFKRYVVSEMGVQGFFFLGLARALVWQASGPLVLRSFGPLVLVFH